MAKLVHGAHYPGGCQPLNTTVKGWLSSGHLDPQYAVGALDFAVSSCLNCHTYRKANGQSLHTPDLTHIGGTRTQTQLIAVIKCPTCVHPGSRMPSFRSMSKQIIDQLTAFLAASR